MKIGILGGSFDPPHRGHLKLAQAAIEALELDEVILLPAAKNPMKAGRVSATPKDRLEMLKRLIHGHPKLSISDMEITRGGLSYTVDTLGELQMVRPAEYWFLMGADALKGFSEWKNPQRILRLCRIGVVARPPLSLKDIETRIPEEFADRFDIIPMPADAASSTIIKDTLRTGKLAPELLPKGVLDYIKQNRIYPLP